MASKPPISDGQLSQLVRQENLKRPLKWVIGLHILFIVIAAIGLPRFKKEPFDLTQAVNVDLIAPNADVSAAPNKSHSKEPFKPQSKPVEKKKPPIAQPEKPPSTVQSEAAKKDDTPKPVEKPEEKAPEPPKPEVKKEEPKKEQPKKEEAMKKAPPEKPKAEKPKKQTPKKSRDDGAGNEQEQKQFNSVLKNLLGDADAKVSAPEGNPVDKPFDDTKPQGEAPVTSDKLSLSEMDALKYQLAQCWNVPTGAMNAADLIVDIRLEVKPDRTVQSAEIVDQARYNSDDFFRAAADSARRAVFNPRCTPLALPPDKYDTWKDILIRFNPKDMFGG